jgi:hypothetical protein
MGYSFAAGTTDGEWSVSYFNPHHMPRVQRCCMQTETDGVGLNVVWWGIFPLSRGKICNHSTKQTTLKKKQSVQARCCLHCHLLVSGPGMQPFYHSDTHTGLSPGLGLVHIVTYCMQHCYQSMHDAACTTILPVAGPGVQPFYQSDNHTGLAPASGLVHIVNAALRSKPNSKQTSCQGSKPILLNVGQATRPYPWVPRVTEMAMLRLANFVSGL